MKKKIICLLLILSLIFLLVGCTNDETPPEGDGFDPDSLPKVEDFHFANTGFNAANIASVSTSDISSISSYLLNLLKATSSPAAPTADKTTVTAISKLNAHALLLDALPKWTGVKNHGKEELPAKFHAIAKDYYSLYLPGASTVNLYRDDLDVPSTSPIRYDSSNTSQKVFIDTYKDTSTSNINVATHVNTDGKDTSFEHAVFSKVGEDFFVDAFEYSIKETIVTLSFTKVDKNIAMKYSFTMALDKPSGSISNGRYTSISCEYYNLSTSIGYSFTKDAPANQYLNTGDYLHITRIAVSLGIDNWLTTCDNAAAYYAVTTPIETTLHDFLDLYNAAIADAEFELEAG